ncbi:hypothetical protein BSKO_00005 [Bryopsis sp. KO-2023]|nr:hypothetical protein BSKO_00005 [Bryopsis sp. KO-2023]
MAGALDRIRSHSLASTWQGSLVQKHQKCVSLVRGRTSSTGKRYRNRKTKNFFPCAQATSNGSGVTGSTDDDLCPVDTKTKYIAETLLPTRSGKFRLRGYRHTTDEWATYTEPTAVISGDVQGKSDVAVRVHDACFTSEVLGSLKCDCAEQLELALDYIQENPPGLIIYLQQEGRGIGLANKIAAYALQEKGLDTVDANRALGLPDDCREYTPVRNILKDLGVKSIKLMTNNPRKIDVMTKLGIAITGRIPCIVEGGKYSKEYLAAKEKRMNHQLNGEWCFWNHDGEPGRPSSGKINDGFTYPSGSDFGPLFEGKEDPENTDQGTLKN